MEPEAGMRQREERSADCLQKVEEAGADPFVDPRGSVALPTDPSVLTQ